MTDEYCIKCNRWCGEFQVCSCCGAGHKFNETHYTAEQLEQIFQIREQNWTLL